jgi:GT2 family glycosyltransferase
VSSDAVTIGYVHDVEVAYSWHSSMVDLIGHDLNNHQRVIRGGWIGVRYGTGGIVEARNTVVRRFLEHDRSDWLFWIDTDMGFGRDTVDRLMSCADPVSAPIVGALCFANRETHSDGMGGFRTKAVPTVYYWGKNGEQSGFQAVAEYPNDELLRCDATGSACVLIHRSAFEAIGANWYNPVSNPDSGLMMGEDLSFCVRAGAAHAPVHVHTGVRTTHLKRVWLQHEDFVA